MKIGRLAVAGFIFALVCAGGPAWATIWEVQCPGGSTNTSLTQLTNQGALVNGPFNFAVDPGTQTQPDALGAILGTASQPSEISNGTFGFTAALEPGDDVAVLGICEQDVAIRTSGISISSSSGDVAVMSAPPTLGAFVNTIHGETEILGAQNVIFNTIVLGSTASTVTLPTGYPGAGQALLFVHGGGSAILQNMQVAYSPTRGILLDGSSTAVLESTLVTNNGIGDTNLRTNSGVEVTNGSTVQLGAFTQPGVSTDNYPSTVSNNAGEGIFAVRDGAAVMFAGTLSGNGQHQLYLFNSSSARLTGNNVASVTVETGSSTADDAIAAQDGSSLLIELGASITAGTTNPHAIDLMGGSVMLLQGSTVVGGAITIEATGTSTVALAGSNVICNGSLVASSCNTPYVTAAFQIDHVSSLVDVGPNLANAEYPQVGDEIGGAGTVQLQSSADLGAGSFTSGPSVTWTTGTNGIVVSQNSSFRLQGGVTINGKLKLTQASNGFFNGTEGGGNTVTGGVTCPWTSIPASHIAGQTTVSPTPTVMSSYIVSATPPLDAVAGSPVTVFPVISGLISTPNANTATFCLGF